MPKTTRNSEISGFHKAITAELSAVPRRLIRTKLAALIEQKVSDVPKGFAEALADHILAKNKEPFKFDNDDEREVSVDITAADIDLIGTEVRSFVKDEIPEIVTNIIDDAASTFLETLNRDWPAQRDWQMVTTEGFKERLEDRWGRGFDILRMMYTIANEIGGIANQRRRRSRAKRNLVLQDTITHLHIRACQVVAEILFLMENGFADGAMARWRTLHEITVVAAVIAHFGEELAVRYRAHEAVEAKRAMDRYQVSHAALGLSPFGQKDIREVEDHYQAALALYGDRFGSEYGWAGCHLDLKKPRFIDLEKAAGKLEMRPYYGLASYNVHASAMGIAFRLGLPRELAGPTGLAGASNTGFVDPAQNAAFDIAFITSLILRPHNIDDMIQLKILLLLRGKIAAKLTAADRRIKKEHRAHLRAGRAQ